MRSAKQVLRSVWISLLVALGVGNGVSAQAPRTSHSAPRTSNVILVVIDGVRWQEVFRGGDCALMTKTEGGVEDTLALRARFCRGDADSARRALLPFLWGTVAREGILLGDRDRGGDGHISNTMKFSYPGYNEIVTGAADPRIDKNAFGPNPNTTVFEWLASRPGFAGRVRVWGTWDVFDAIFNESRAGIPVRSGWDVPFPGPRNEVERELDALWATTTRHWDYMPPDAFLQRALLRSVRADRPRALFIGFGEPDEWAHDRRYDHYLGSLHAADGFLKELWETLQSLPSYRGVTTLLIVTDHGRGRTPVSWTDHGRTVDGAEEIGSGRSAPGCRRQDRRPRVPPSCRRRWPPPSRRWSASGGPASTLPRPRP